MSDGSLQARPCPSKPRQKKELFARGVALDRPILGSGCAAPVKGAPTEPAAPVSPEPATEAPPEHEHPHEHQRARADERPHSHEHTATGPAAPHDTRQPALMSPLQKAGWWTLLGAVALTTTTTALGGVSAREEGRRRRLELVANGPSDAPMGETAAQTEARADIERSRARGRAFSTSAVVVGSVAGTIALAGVIMLVVDVARRRPPTPRRARLSGAGIEVRF